MIVIADTSALFAHFDAAQPEHEQARAVMAAERMVISPFVLTELDHLVHRDVGFAGAMAAVESLTDRIVDGDYVLAAVTNDDLVRAARVRQRYEDLKLDLADAVGVVIADNYRTNRIFTLDQRDFRAVVPLTAGFGSFIILPADMH